MPAAFPAIPSGPPGPPGPAGDPTGPFTVANGLLARSSYDRFSDRIYAEDYALGDGSLETSALQTFFSVLAQNFDIPGLNIPATAKTGYFPSGIWRSAPTKIQSAGEGWTVCGAGLPSQLQDIEIDLAHPWAQVRDLRLIGNGGQWTGAAKKGVRFGSSRALSENVHVYQRPVGFSQTDNLGTSPLPAKNVMQNCLTYQCALGVQAGDQRLVGEDITAELHMIGCDITSSLAHLNPTTFIGTTHGNNTIDGLIFSDPLLDANEALSLHQRITGAGILANTIITAIAADGNSITISNPAITSAATSLTVTGPGVGLRQMDMGQLRTTACHVIEAGLHCYEIIGQATPALTFPNESFHTGSIFGGAGLYGREGHTPRQLTITNIQDHPRGMLVTVSPSTEDWFRGMGPVHLSTGHGDYDVLVGCYVVNVIAPNQLVLSRPYVAGGPTTGTAYTQNWAVYAIDNNSPSTIRSIHFTGGYNTTTRIDAGYDWSFVNTRMTYGKWLGGYIGSLFELCVSDNVYGGLGSNPGAPNNERFRDMEWYGPGSLENIRIMGPFRLNPLSGFFPHAGDTGVGMKMAHTASGLGSWNGPLIYNAMMVSNLGAQIDCGLHLDPDVDQLHRFFFRDGAFSMWSNPEESPHLQYFNLGVGGNWTSRYHPDEFNWEVAYFGSWTGDTAFYGTGRAGSGLARDVAFLCGGIEQLRLVNGVAIFGSPDIDFTQQLQIRAYRTPAGYRNAVLHLSAPRADTPVGETSGGRGALAIPGNASTLDSSMFIAANTANINVNGDAAAWRLNQSVIELTSFGYIDFWQSGVRHTRLGPGLMNVTGLPTADPHVVGDVWLNAGVMTVSAG